MKIQRKTGVLALIVSLTLITGCESANEDGHDCKAIAKAISQSDKPLLRSEYDKLMLEDLVENLPYSAKGSYSTIYGYCVKLDQGTI